MQVNSVKDHITEEDKKKSLIIAVIHNLSSSEIKA